MSKSRVNLFTGDRSFVQHKLLFYLDRITELKYQKESFRFHQTSLSLYYLLILLVGSAYLVLEKNQYVVASVVIPSIIILLIFRDRSQHLQRILAEVSLNIFILTILEEGSLLECFGACFPGFVLNFFLSQSWIIYLVSGAVEVLCMYFLSDLELTGIILAVLTYTVLSACFEKDYRDLWQLYYSFKKSDSLYKNLFTNSLDAIFIVSPDHRILHYNKQARNLVLTLKSSAELLNQGKFEELFEETHRNLLAFLISNAMKGIKGEEEIFFKKPPLTLLPEETSNLGCLLNAQICNWMGKHCVKCTCMDVSNFISRLLLVTDQYKKQLETVHGISRQYSQLFEYKEPMEPEHVMSFEFMFYRMLSILLLQSHFLSRFELRKNCFDINFEVQNVIDIWFVKSSVKHIGINYTRDQGIPKSVESDKALHNHVVHTLVGFAVNNAKKETEVSLVVEVNSAVDKELNILYKISFTTYRVSQGMLDTLFQVRKNNSKRRDLHQIMQITDKYGIELAVFDTTLCLLKGFISDIYAPSSGEGKVLIVVSLPVTRTEKQSKSKLIKLNHECINETPLSIKWKPALVDDLRPQKKVPVPQPKTLSVENVFSQKVSPVRPLMNGLVRPVFVDKRNLSSSESVSIYSSDEEFINGLETESPKNLNSLSELLIYSLTVQIKESPRSLKNRFFKNLKRPPSSKNNPFQNIDYSATDSKRTKVFKHCPKENGILSFELNTFKVLIVDDVAMQREALKVILDNIKPSNADYAKDGFGAIKIFEEYAKQGYKYKVIFMDIMMPRLDGLKATKRIRQIEKDKNYPRTFICGLSGDENAASKCEEAGMDHFILKPVTDDSIQSFLED